MHWPSLVLLALLTLGYAELIAATHRRGTRRHARFWSWPHPHRAVKAGRHTERYRRRTYTARH